MTGTTPSPPDSERRDVSALELQDDMRARAAALQAESFVFDFSPLGEPFIRTPATDQAMQDALAQGAPVRAVVRAMVNARLRELETNADVRACVREAWRASGVDAVLLTLGGLAFSSSDWDASLRDAAYWHRRVRAADDMAICTSAAELRAAAANGRVGLVLGTQDLTQIGRDLERIDLLYDLGARVMQLTFNVRNQIGDGCTEREQSGLSRFGLDVVRHLNDLGIVVDVSHSGRQTTLDAIEHSERPVAVTHASCDAVAPHPRAKTDEQLRALRERGGYIGIVAVPFFVAPHGGASVDVIARHVEHAAEVAGIEHVGIGTDWGGWSPDFPVEIKQMARDSLAAHGFSRTELPPFGAGVEGFDAWEAWSEITAALLRRGFTSEQVRGVIGGNWLAFLERCGL
jgi:membrane dipeptidase